MDSSRSRRHVKRFYCSVPEERWPQIFASRPAPQHCRSHAASSLQSPYHTARKEKKLLSSNESRKLSHSYVRSRSATVCVHCLAPVCEHGFAASPSITLCTPQNELKSSFLCGVPQEDSGTLHRRTSVSIGAVRSPLGQTATFLQRLRGRRAQTPAQK